MPESRKTTYDKGEVMKLKISKLLLEGALMFQAKNDVRYYLNGICFMPDGRVSATDGHRLFVGGNHDNAIEENIIVAVTKSPVKSYAVAYIDTDTRIVDYLNMDYDNIDWNDAVSLSTMRSGVGLCAVIDGKFPDIDRVIPKQTAPAEQIGFNAKYLADVEKCAKLFNPKFESVRFELNGNTNAAVANLSSPTGETAKIIVMPMRID